MKKLFASGIVALILVCLVAQTVLAFRFVPPTLSVSYQMTPELSRCAVYSDSTGVILSMTATAYTAGYESTGKRPGDRGYGITASGAKVFEGVTIATDPSVLPLGVRASVWYHGKQLGHYTAQDVGGLIKGCIIDIYMDDLQDALDWGRRTVYLRVSWSDLVREGAAIKQRELV